MKIRIISALYFLAGMANIVAQVTGSRELNLYTKPLLMPLLMYVVYLTAAGTVRMATLLLAAALVFSWAGDLLLLYQQEELFFLSGLGAFLVAQILYVVVLNKSAFEPLTFRVTPLIPVILYGIILLAVLLPGAGALWIPVLLYAICLLAMVSSAIFRKGVTSENSFRWALTGAVLFVVSDSLLAVNRFVTDLPKASLYVMMTYILAQYYLVRGILLHQDDQSA